MLTSFTQIYVTLIFRKSLFSCCDGQCPDLQSLESLWNDYHSGVLNEAAEKLLVTDDIKGEINLETVKLKTIIEVDSYLICKKALTEKSGELVCYQFSWEIIP